MAIQSKAAPIGPWGKATAGATGAVLANALVYPLDMYVFFSEALRQCFVQSPNALSSQSQD